MDAPCDDFNWMKLVTGDASINSIGGDIIRPMVERNKEKYFRKTDHYFTKISRQARFEE